MLVIEYLASFTLCCMERGWAHVHKSRLFLSLGFKYSPARHYCCHSRTCSGLLTLPAQKRLGAWHARAKHIPQRWTCILRCFLQRLGCVSLQPDTLLFVCLSWFLTEVSSACVTAQEAGRRWAPSSIGQLDVSQHLMCRLRSEFATTHRPPSCLIIRLDMLVLQATAQLCVGSVFLYTFYFLFFDTLLLSLFFGFGFWGFWEFKKI